MSHNSLKQKLYSPCLQRIYLVSTSQLFYLIIIFCGFGKYLLSMLSSIHFDEGVFLTIARLISQGSRLYFDYFDHKPPGLHYLLSIFFQLNISSIFFYRLIVFLVHLCSARIVVKITNGFGAGIPTVLGMALYMSFLPLFNGQFVLAEPFMTFFLLLSLFLLFSQISSKYFLSGMSWGAALLFKQTAILFLPAFILLFFSHKVNESFIKINTFLFGCFSLLLPIFLLFSNQGIISQAFEQVVLYNILSYPPLPLSQTFTSLFPQIVEAFLLIIGMILFLRSNAKIIYKRSLLFTLIFYFPVLLFRPSHHYWIPLLPFLLIMLLVILQTHRVFRYLVYTQVLIVFTVQLFHAVFTEYPKLLEQYETARISSSCKEPMSPEIYFLTTCTPNKKHFYVVR